MAKEVSITNTHFIPHLKPVTRIKKNLLTGGQTVKNGADSLSPNQMAPATSPDKSIAMNNIRGDN
jgi:hypothetical protein